MFLTISQGQVREKSENSQGISICVWHMNPDKSNPTPVHMYCFFKVFLVVL